MLIQSFVLNELYTNTYVVGEPHGEVFILDPGDEEMHEVIDYVMEQGLTVKYIINTHAHYDHVLGNERLRKQFAVPLLINELELDTLTQLPNITQMLFNQSVVSNPPDQYLREHDTLDVGRYQFRVIATPGHSPGGICLYEAQAGVLFAGDTIFAGTIGRTDLPGGNAIQLLQSLREKLWPLPDEVVIYPGHEEESTIGEERMHNPYFNFS
jgi:glyoxylase-like metal-dependent hydrolase (beta-lactamase superfamily II)